MCLLDSAEKAKVESVLREEVLVKGAPFTGRDVAACLLEANGAEVSRYVREIFNNGGMPGWASTQVVPGAGPVLYFPVPPRSVAGIAAEKIRRKLVRQ
jgi:hypothetical protein